VQAFLTNLRLEVKVTAQTFRPLPVCERMIPRAGGKLRRLGIATVRDRVVQTALKLVLEPIMGGGLPAVPLRFAAQAARS
jgi:RNA-directed DNA polymerase